MEAIKDERWNRILKQLIFRERMRRAYKKIGFTLKHHTALGLQCIDILDAMASRQYGDPNDPKHWKGPWVSLTDLKT